MLKPSRLLRIDLNLLVLFHTVLECGHVGRAAEQLHLTPSAVSHGLGRLRRHLNDPLFLRTPRGVKPTEKARVLRTEVAEILERIERVMSDTQPFEPKTARRCFTIGAPDALATVITSPLMALLATEAPGIDIRLLQLMPRITGKSSTQAWLGTLQELELQTLDLVILPIKIVPPRFEQQLLFEEDFVVVMRQGHPLAGRLTYRRFIGAQHLLVSAIGDAFGVVDSKLAEKGHARRIVLTVPSFAMAMPQIADSDLIATLPRHLVALHARRFKLITCRVPLPWTPDPIRVVAARAALADAGVRWLFQAVQRAAGNPVRGEN